LFFKSNVDRQNKDTFKTTIKSSKGLAWRSGANSGHAMGYTVAKKCEWL